MAEGLVDVGEVGEGKAQKYLIVALPAPLCDLSECTGQAEHTGDIVHLCLPLQPCHTAGEKDRLSALLVPLHQSAAMDPHRFTALVINPAPEIVGGSVLSQHTADIVNIELTISFIDPLLQLGHKVDDQITREAELFLQIVRDEIGVLLDVAAAEIGVCVRHGDGAQKQLHVEMVVSDIVLQR